MATPPTMSITHTGSNFASAAGTVAGSPRRATVSATPIVPRNCRMAWFAAPPTPKRWAGDPERPRLRVAGGSTRPCFAAPRWPPSYERRIPQRKLAELAKATVAELRSGPRRFDEVRTLLEPHATPDISPAFLWRRIQGQAPVVHVPPSGKWATTAKGVPSRRRGDRRGSAVTRRRVRAPDPPDLTGFGPATKQDIAKWAGLPRVDPISEVIASLDLRTFADERGAGLYDLPDAALPDPETPAPPRLVLRYDNLVLSHADRSRVLGDVPVGWIVTKNALVHATILVDGFVVGTWQLENGRVKREPAPGSRRRLRRDSPQRSSASSFVA